MSDASPVIPGQTVILCGNGPSAVMGAPRGGEVDAFDVVVRFNAYALRGFEAYVGSKTTLWSTFGRGVKPRDADVIPEAVLYIHGAFGYTPPIPVPVGYGITPAFFANLRAQVVERSKIEDSQRLEKLLPSSGLLVASWLLHCGAHHIVLHGFDHFKKERSSGHHYWLPQAFGRPKEHDGDAEADIFAELIAAGRVSYFDSRAGA